MHWATFAASARGHPAFLVFISFIKTRSPNDLIIACRCDRVVKVSDLSPDVRKSA